MPGRQRKEILSAMRSRAVVDLAAALAPAAAQREVADELSDRVEALRDARDAQQRILEPLLQEAAAHRRLRKVEDIEERVLLAAIAQVARDLEVAQRVRVDDEVL